MSNNPLVESILVQHLAEQLKVLSFTNSIFEEVQEFKINKHIDNANVLSLVLEFIGPFRKQGVADLEKMGQSNLVKNLQKNMKYAIKDAVKAGASLRSVDLTNVNDVQVKVGSLVKAMATVGAIEKDLMSGEMDADPGDVVTPDMDKMIKSLYALSAHTLNGVIASLNANIAQLQKVLPQSTVRSAVQQHQTSMASKDAQAQRKADLKGITTPVHKQVGNWVGGAMDTTGWGPSSNREE